MPPVSHDDKPHPQVDNTPSRPSYAPTDPGQRAAARLALFAWLEVWYNRQRHHSALAYRSPVAYEEHVLLLQDLAA